MSEKKYLLVKYVSLIVYTIICIVLILKLILIIDESDKVYILYFSIMVILIWLIIFLVSIRSCIFEIWDNQNRNNYLIILSVFHILPLYATFIFLKSIIIRETSWDWIFFLLVLLNGLYFMNFIKPTRANP